MPFDKTGDDHPRPGTSIFHEICVVASHASGTFSAAEIPCAVGPRNCGHSASEAWSHDAKPARVLRMIGRKFMEVRADNECMAGSANALFANNTMRGRRSELS